MAEKLIRVFPLTLSLVLLGPNDSKQLAKCTDICYWSKCSLTIWIWLFEPAFQVLHLKYFIPNILLAKLIDCDFNCYSNYWTIALMYFKNSVGYLKTKFSW
jgi:hypothetical protein